MTLPALPQERVSPWPSRCAPRAGKTPLVENKVILAGSNEEVTWRSMRARLDRVAAGDVEPGGGMHDDGITSATIVTRRNTRSELEAWMAHNTTERVAAEATRAVVEAVPPVAVCLWFPRGVPECCRRSRPRRLPEESPL